MKMIIDGKKVDSLSGATFDVTAPATGKVIESVPKATAEAVSYTHLIIEIIEKEAKGKSYHTYKYSYDSIGLPSIDYDDDPNKIMKWKESVSLEI